MRPPAALVLELAHGAMSTHVLGALARLDVAEHHAAGPRGLADLAALTGTDPELLDRLLRVATALGGGHGTLLQALLATAPRAQGVLLDLPEVVRVAPAAERVEFLVGDFMTSVPAGADVYVLCHVLHDWDDDAARRILATCRRAAPAGARLLIVEAVLADEPGPLTPEVLSLHLLVMSGGGERRRDQFGRLLDSAGWQLGEVTPLPGGQSILTARPR
jgi:hypothetical protein